jgi:hypothetical protein
MKEETECGDGIWQDAPNTTLHEGSSAWNGCVKRWRLALTDRERRQMILEVGTGGGEVYRHIIFLDQLVNVVTKIRSGDDGGEPIADTVEEVILDIRNTGGWEPAKIKLRCMGGANSLALQMAIIDFLGHH